jgi:hypothetical protein
MKLLKTLMAVAALALTAGNLKAEALSDSLSALGLPEASDDITPADIDRLSDDQVRKLAELMPELIYNQPLQNWDIETLRYRERFYFGEIQARQHDPGHHELAPPAKPEPMWVTNVRHGTMKRDNGTVENVCTFDFNGTGYYVDELDFKSATAEGIILGHYLVNMKNQGAPPLPNEEMVQWVLEDGKKHFSDKPADYPYVYFYGWVVSVWAMEILNPQTPHSAAEQPTDDVVAQAMNRLQDTLGKPHIKSGVWYDGKSDTYNWIGPKLGQQMTAPATQLLHDLVPYL